MQKTCRGYFANFTRKSCNKIALLFNKRKFPLFNESESRIDVDVLKLIRTVMDNIRVLH